MAALLDMDMATLGRLGREGFAWWVEELGALVPPRLRALARSTPAVTAAWAGGRFVLSRDGAVLATQPDPRRPLPVQVVLPEDAALVRTLDLPGLGARDLERLVALDLDRLMPFPPGTAIASVETGGRDADGRTAVRVAALPRAAALDVAARAKAEGLDVRALALATPAGPRFDFLPALRLDTAARGPRFWWTAVAVTAVLLVAMLIVRDVERTRALQALVDEQAQAAATARTLRLRVVAEDARRRAWVARRAERNVLGLLSETTRVVPARAWVQRFDWTGPQLRLSGYKAGDVDMLAALRRSPLVKAVRPSTGDAAPAQALGQPWDVTVDLAAAP